MPQYRNVTFTFSSDSSGTDPTVSMVLTILDSGGVTRARIPLAPTDTTTTVVLEVGTNYVATLVSTDAAGQNDPSPPSVTFDVPAIPPLPPVLLPADPTLSTPTIS